jgi:trimeric autotransporter adhesin
VNGDDYVGGLVGDNQGAVSNSYSTGSVTGEWHVGGLVGYNEGSVSNSYSTGSVAGSVWIGGLVGSNRDGTVSNSFWDRVTSGRVTSDGGTGKTTTEMMDIATFVATGWGIAPVALGVSNPDYTWNIIVGETYPFLSWQV